jgi:heat shock protein 5
VVDIGGGATNVTLASIENGVCEVNATAGEDIGGEDFDHTLMDYCIA